MNSDTLDSVLLQTDYTDLELFASGKVRDVYSLESEHLLFIATDRISAFDYVLATGIPHKGRVLTQISLFWFDFLKDIVPNHFVTADVNHYPQAVRKHADELRGRSMMVMRAADVPRGVRCARLPLWLGLEGIQGERYRLRHQAACGIEGVRPTTGADLYTRHQGDDRARHQHFIRRDVQTGGPQTEPPTPPPDACASTRKPPTMRGSVAF